MLSRVSLFATPWSVAYQAPLSMGFSRQEYWSGLPFSTPGDLPNPGIELRFSALQADSLLSEPPGKPGRKAGSINFWHVPTFSRGPTLACIQGVLGLQIGSSLGTD